MIDHDRVHNSTMQQYNINGLEVLYKEPQAIWKAKSTKMSLPIWFSRLGIRVKKKRLCHYFLEVL
jgi:hypothetical protein